MTLQQEALVAGELTESAPQSAETFWRGACPGPGGRAFHASMKTTFSGSRVCRDLTKSG